MGAISRALKLLSLVLTLLLVGVTLDVSLNNGSITRNYLPSLILDKFEELRNSLASKTEDRVIIESFERYLNDPQELSLLRNLSASLKGEDIVSSAWNILVWEDEHLSYDSNRTEPMFVLPSEFLSRGKGICGDYALLTAGLLLAMNYSPVYVLALEFNDSDAGHLAAAIAVDSRYLVIDQHPPLMDLGAYYRHWAFYEKNPSHISKATLYRLSWSDGKIIMKRYRELSWEDFFAQDYNMTEEDLNYLRDALLMSFKERYSLSPDPLLPKIAEGGMSERYHWVLLWRGVFPGYADYYLPVTRERMASYMLDQIATQREFRERLREAEAFWLDLSREGADLTLTVYIAGWH